MLNSGPVLVRAAPSWKQRGAASLLDKGDVQVRPVNHGVAVGAGLAVRGPAVEAVDVVGGNRAVALIAERVDVRHVQQASVLRAMRCVATEAAFALDGSMLIHERATGFHVALDADCILIGGGFEVAALEGAVDIMAIAALDQAFVDLVMEGHVEVWADVGVALVAEVRLGGDEELRIRYGLVDTVAAEAGNAGPGMRRAQEVGVGIGVAAEAGLIDLGGCEFVEANDLGHIATAFDVCLAWTVAALAGIALAAVLEGQLGVRIVHHAIGHNLVAGGAGVIAYVSIRWSGFGGRALFQCLGLGLSLGDRESGAARGQDPDHGNQKEIVRYLAGHLSHVKTPLCSA